ncbi:hypothetical protein BDP27DRAFT_1426517 [Rhodocollybia butyracea]|uniref:Protein kinase domain-containing protein n=1 Tax=Rhodocollybia butyracea TaxID=206335 RepID=A0A9P5PDR2_9AGAR|nr:hypothetical protein BDP27DRAFT_1426517 [Rhodocollybia butyracea]
MILDLRKGQLDERWGNLIGKTVSYTVSDYPDINVSAAVFTDRPTIETLTSIPLNVHSTNIKTIAAGERLVYSLRVAFKKLSDYYSTQLFKTEPVRSNIDFPFCNFYTIDEKKYYFAYERWEQERRKFMNKKRIYRAHMKDGHSQCVLVKFTRRYSVDAHRAASDANIAPELIAGNEVYDWYMAVMDDISETYVSADQLDIQTQRSMRGDITDAVKRLHERGFVHGDVRDVNVLIRRASADSHLPSVKLVDFDWGGAIGKMAYPSGINSREIRWPEGVVAGAEIKTKHDLEMVTKIGV